ncbi:MAG: TIGR00300 family protein [Methanomicrobiales archaeon]|nr:TIGR00300 family protein [Methanomicrobiales archaeon]
MESGREIELEGHIIDSGVMTLVFDRIMDMGGEFEILTFDVGKLKTDTSYARLRVSAPDVQQLDAILYELHRLGARTPEISDVILVPAEGDRILPKGFYSTTNHPTFVKYQDEWLPVERIEMDCHIVVDKERRRAICRPISKIKAGDAVVVSEAGVRVIYPERPRKAGTFEFMHGTVSSERPSEAIIARIAREILKLKGEGGKIALVGGPAIVHTGAAGALADMIREGYIDVLFAGNALATHDIESNLFGTSLGMDVRTGTLITGGHKHHICAISEVMRAGSIRGAVEQGIVTGGVMYECVKKGVPFVLAGSIRDDGPLPDVITDAVEAQDAMRRHIQGLGMVVMVGTLLHSIAVGNCLPSYVKTVCVDINPASVTKLMDRGTTQAIGVVSDAGTFLPLLAKQLEKQKKRSVSV